MTAQFGIPTTPVPSIRFDTYLPAQNAARAGAGVLLASLALCQAELKAGRLVRLSDDVLRHHESYWVVAGEQALSRSQWQDLTQTLLSDAK
jgi:LysR family glycine cleavage system transcriptional activator